MMKHPSTKLKNYSEKVDEFLNKVYLLKDENIEYEFLVDLMEDIQSWRSCLDEIELSVKSNHIFNNLQSDLYEYDDDNKEVIIY
jgi:hypothetical protein